MEYNSFIIQNYDLPVEENLKFLLKRILDKKTFWHNLNEEIIICKND
jgi:hypothetical protein